MNQNERKEKFKGKYRTRNISTYSELDYSYDGDYHESTNINDKVTMKIPRINEEITLRLYGYQSDYISHYGYIFPYEFIRRIYRRSDMMI